MNHDQIVFPMDADVQAPVLLRRAYSSAASRRFDVVAISAESISISHNFAWAADMQLHVVNYDETAHVQPIQPFDPHEYLDNMSDEEYRDFVQTAMNCTSTHTLPAYSVPTRE